MSAMDMVAKLDRLILAIEKAKSETATALIVVSSGLVPFEDNTLLEKWEDLEAACDRVASVASQESAEILRRRAVKAARQRESDAGEQASLAHRV
jgi:type VI protein secretion system component VasF